MTNTKSPAARLNPEHPLYSRTRHELVSKLADLAADVARYDVLIAHGDESLAEAFSVGRAAAERLRAEADRLVTQTDVENRRAVAAHCARRSA